MRAALRAGRALVVQRGGSGARGAEQRAGGGSTRASRVAAAAGRVAARATEQAGESGGEGGPLGATSSGSGCCWGGRAARRCARAHASPHSRPRSSSASSTGASAASASSLFSTGPWSVSDRAQYRILPGAGRWAGNAQLCARQGRAGQFGGCGRPPGQGGAGQRSTGSCRVWAVRSGRAGAGQGRLASGRGVVSGARRAGGACTAAAAGAADCPAVCCAVHSQAQVTAQELHRPALHPTHTPTRRPTHLPTMLASGSGPKLRLSITCGGASSALSASTQQWPWAQGSGEPAGCVGSGGQAWGASPRHQRPAKCPRPRIPCASRPSRCGSDPVNPRSSGGTADPRPCRPGSRQGRPAQRARLWHGSHFKRGNAAAGPPNPAAAGPAGSRHTFGV